LSPFVPLISHLFLFVRLRPPPLASLSSFSSFSPSAGLLSLAGWIRHSLPTAHHQGSHSSLSLVQVPSLRSLPSFPPLPHQHPHHHFVPIHHCELPHFRWLWWWWWWQCSHPRCSLAR